MPHNSMFRNNCSLFQKTIRNIHKWAVLHFDGGPSRATETCVNSTSKENVQFVSATALPSSLIVTTKRTELGRHKPTQRYFCSESCPITFSKLGTFQHTTGIRVVDLKVLSAVYHQILVLSLISTSVFTLFPGRDAQNTLQICV
jgi:hypothetical protein